MNNLGATYYDMGQFKPAVDLHKRAVEGRKAVLGENHPDTLGSMSNLAAAYIATGQHDLAVPLCERTIGIQRSRLGPDHPDTLTSMNNLAVAYEGTGQRPRHPTERAGARAAARQAGRRSSGHPDRDEQSRGGVLVRRPARAPHSAF